MPAALHNVMLLTTEEFPRGIAQPALTSEQSPSTMPLATFAVPAGQLITTVLNVKLPTTAVIDAITVAVVGSSTPRAPGHTLAGVVQRLTSTRFVWGPCGWQNG